MICQPKVVIGGQVDHGFSIIDTAGLLLTGEGAVGDTNLDPSDFEALLPRNAVHPLQFTPIWINDNLSALTSLHQLKTLSNTFEG